MIDLLKKSVEDPPIAKTKLLCRHPFDQKKRAFVVPSEIKPLYKVNLRFIVINNNLFIFVYCVHLGLLGKWAYNATTTRVKRSPRACQRIFKNNTPRH